MAKRQPMPESVRRVMIVRWRSMRREAREIKNYHARKMREALRIEQRAAREVERFIAMKGKTK